MTAEKNQQENNFKQQAIAYFRGVKTEWSKVSWPTKKQVGFETVIVLAVVTVFTVLVYIIDWIFKYLLGLIK